MSWAIGGEFQCVTVTIIWRVQLAHEQHAVAN
jgi:hypothetical protein